MPLSSVWAGPSGNDHLAGPPLLMAKTAGSTPFRLSTHVGDVGHRSEEHTSELQSLMRISYAVFCLKKKTRHTKQTQDDVFIHIRHRNRLSIDATRSERISESVR